MTKVYLLFTFIFLLGLSIFNTSCSNSDKKTSSMLNSYKDRADQMANQAKIKMIETAVKMYAVEYGQDPESLDELVEKGYLKHSDIVDQNGNKLPLTPSGIATGSELITKSCGACGKEVSPTSKVGDRCPHCGVIWGQERQMN